MRQDSCITGTGILLLFAWLLVFANVFMSKPDHKVSNWRKRMEPFQMKEESSLPNNNMVLVLSTTLIPTEVQYFVIELIYRTSMDRLQSYSEILYTFCLQCQMFRVSCFVMTSTGLMSVVNTI